MSKKITMMQVDSFIRVLDNMSFTKGTKKKHDDDDNVKSSVVLS